MAEGVGFEPTVPQSGTPIFETGTLIHSVTLPYFADSKAAQYFTLPFTHGALGETRTLNPQLRKLMLYPIELQAHIYILMLLVQLTNRYIIHVFLIELKEQQFILVRYSF